MQPMHKLDEYDRFKSKFKMNANGTRTIYDLTIISIILDFLAGLCLVGRGRKKNVNHSLDG